MRLLMLGVLLLSAGVAYGAQCTIVDHGDHYEAACIGADTAPAARQPALQALTQAALAEPAASQDPGVADDGLAPQVAAEERDVDSREVTLTRGEIGRRHAAYWLATTPRY